MDRDRPVDHRNRREHHLPGFGCLPPASQPIIMSVPASSPTSPKGQGYRHGFWVFLPVFLAAGLVVLAILERQVFSYGPPCVFRQLTGLNCPGCGGTRAFFALVHGEFLRSVRYNPLTLLLLLALVFWLLRSSIRSVFPGQRSINLPVLP